MRFQQLLDLAFIHIRVLVLKIDAYMTQYFFIFNDFCEYPLLILHHIDSRMFLFGFNTWMNYINGGKTT